MVQNEEDEDIKLDKLKLLTKFEDDTFSDHMQSGDATYLADLMKVNVFQTDQQGIERNKNVNDLVSVDNLESFLQNTDEGKVPLKAFL